MMFLFASEKSDHLTLLTKLLENLRAIVENQRSSYEKNYQMFSSLSKNLQVIQIILPLLNLNIIGSA